MGLPPTAYPLASSNVHSSRKVLKNSLHRLASHGFPISCKALKKSPGLQDIGRGFRALYKILMKSVNLLVDQRAVFILHKDLNSTHPLIERCLLSVLC